MTVTDWLASQSQLILGALRDAAGFVLSPRRYLRSIESEQVEVTIRRLCVLALAFAALEIVVFTRGTESVSLLSVAFLGVLEIELSLLVIPVFFAVVRMMGGRSALRVAVAYVLTLRFVALVPAIVTYGVFVATEDYTFALLRGIATAGYMILLLTVLPFAYFDRIRQRAAALIIGLGAFAGYMALVEAVSSQMHTSGALTEQMSLLFDPIGAEVDRYVAPQYQAADSALEPSSFRLAISVTEAGKEDSSHKYVIYQGDTLAALATRWLTERDSFRKNYSRVVDLTNKGRDSARFRTTKELLAAKAAWLTELDKSAKLLDEFVASPRAAKLMPMVRTRTDAEDREIALMRIYVEHIRVRMKLVRAGLLDLPSQPKQTSSDP